MQNDVCYVCTGYGGKVQTFLVAHELDDDVEHLRVCTLLVPTTKNTSNTPAKVSFMNIVSF